MILAHAIMTFFISNQTSTWVQATEVMEITIENSIKEAQAVIEDIERYGHFHPLITYVEKLDEGSYKIKERPYSWMPITIRYCAFIEELTEDKTVYGFSNVVWFKPKFTYRLQINQDQSTQIRLTIKIEGPPLGRRILMNKMVDAQVKLWQAFADSQQTPQID